MTEPFLTLPTKEYQESFEKYARTYERLWQQDKNNHNDEYYDKYKLALTDFDSFLIQQKEYSLGIKLPEEGRQTTSFWLIAKNEVVGVTRIRHVANYLSGNIGYDISPDYRGRGYGNVMLTLALKEARLLGLNEVIVTCEPENIASKTIIEKHGGNYVGTVYNEEDDEYYYKYVIENRD